MLLKMIRNCFLISVFLLCANSAIAKSVETGFLSRTVTVGATTYRYQVYVPQHYISDKKWPVILFLHGGGARGEEGLQQTEGALANAIRQHPERFPSLVVFPQCRVGAVWLDEMEEQALKALDQTVAEFNGDPQRLYLTGLSLGGYGTWAIAARHPGKFTALVVVCGGIMLPARSPLLMEPASVRQSRNPYLTVARLIGRTPVWVFHGSADKNAPVTEARRMVKALRGLGGNVKYTEYQGVGHNSWDKAYAEPDLTKWLLAQRLGK